MANINFCNYEMKLLVLILECHELQNIVLPQVI